MRKNLKSRQLKLETLESRKCLATIVSVSSGGILSITCDSATNLLVEQTAANTWDVTENNALIGTFTGVTGSLSITTSAENDSIEVDLNGHTAPKSIVLQPGDGTNTLNVHDGSVTLNLDYKGGIGNDLLTIAGVTVSKYTRFSLGDGNNEVTVTDSTLQSLGIATGAGDDNVVLGDGVIPVDISGAVIISDKGGPLDALEIKNGVSVGALLTTAVNSVTLRSGSTVTGGISIRGGADVANSLTLEGDIDGNVVFGGSNSVDSLTQSAIATVGGSLVGYLRGDDDLVDLQGDIGGTLYLDMSSGDDTVSVDGQVAGNLAVSLGSGDDFFELLGTVGIAPANSSKVKLDGGLGNDLLALRATAEINGQATINLGAGDDSLAVDDAALLVAIYTLGGSGNDTYYGTLPRVGVVHKGYEVLLTTAPNF